MEEINYLKKFGKSSVKPGLERIELLLKYIDNPQKELKVIHIAGTNGKGSTAAILTSIYKNSGYKVATYTSPGVTELNERIRINDENISDEDLARLVGKIKPYINRVAEKLEYPTFFEIMTAIALLYFAQQNIDLAILETGLGGRLDATNVVNSLVSVITNVSLDHTEYLGNTLEEITKEKAGIIKENQKVITAASKTEVIETIKTVAKKKNAELININNEYSWTEKNFNYRYQKFSVQGPNNYYKDLKLSLLGEYQIINTVTAIAVVEEINKYFPVNKNDMVKSLKKVTWPGRLEIINTSPIVILDGSHNKEGVKFLRKELNKFKYNNLIVVLSILRDKDISSIINEIVFQADKVILSKNKNKRAAEIEEIKKYVSGYNLEIIEKKELKLAVKYALSISEKEDLILIGGSLSTVSEIRNCFLDNNKNNQEFQNHEESLYSYFPKIQV